jgi:hypothetical protein
VQDVRNDDGDVGNDHGDVGNDDVDDFRFDYHNSLYNNIHTTRATDSTTARARASKQA